MRSDEPSTSLADRVAIVTGGSRGIGRAIVHRFRQLGAQVASLDVTPPAEDRALQAADLHLDCDVTDESAVAAAVATATERLGPPQVLVANAGVNAYFDPVSLSTREWDRFFDLDLKSAWVCARAVLPPMLAAGRGAIVNVSSIHATLTQQGMFPYAAAKAGLLGLTRSLALEVAGGGVRVNAVCPGLVRTELALSGIARATDPAATEAALVAVQPLGRMADPLEVADVVAFLAGDGASFVTAAAIPVDGGVSARLPGT